MRNVRGILLAVFFAFGGVGACSPALPPVRFCKADDDCKEAAHAAPSASCDVTSGLCRVVREASSSEHPADVSTEATAEKDDDRPPPDESHQPDENVSPEPSLESLEGRSEPATEALVESPEDAASPEPSGPEKRPEVRPEPKPEVKPEPKPEVKPEPRPEPKPEVVKEAPCVPEAESCNNKDDDCDGKIDENVTGSCYTGATGTQGIGLCKAGKQICNLGTWGACVGEVTPKTEICDDKDNNCDGKIDEGLPCVLVPAGSFTQGSPANEAGRESDEGQRLVTLTRAFFIQTTEVTQADFQALIGSNPSFWKSCGGTCPAENLTWHQALAYANALSRKDGFPECFACTGTSTGTRCSLRNAYPTPYDCPGWRLPTEAEWEYAARAGTTTATPLGELTPAKIHTCLSDAAIEPLGWYCSNAGGKTRPIRSKQPNAWGLYDILGNVSEWVWDGYAATRSGSATDPVGATGDTKIRRGGGWTSTCHFLRSAERGPIHAVTAVYETGFRLARTHLPTP